MTLFLVTVACLILAGLGLMTVIYISYRLVLNIFLNK